MAVKKTSTTRRSNSTVESAAELLLKREEERVERGLERARRRGKKRLREERESVKKMHHSIEVIKGCVVGICAVWVLSFIISIVLLVRLHAEVAEIEKQVDGIKHVIDNPFATAGARMGGDLDERLKDWLGLPEPPEAGE